MRIVGFALGLTVLSAAPAFSQPASKAASGTMPAMAAGPSSPTDQAMMAGMEKMNQDMHSAPMTGDADQDFVGMMVPHHLGAVDMARAELKYGKDPSLRALAKDIIAAQEKEVAEMRRWQKLHPVTSR